MTKLRKIMATAMALSCIGLSGARAAPSRAALGMSLEATQALYPGAKLTRSGDGQTRLEFADADFADLHWRTVAFLFDGGNRLDKVQLTTKAMTFDRLKAKITANLDGFLAAQAQSQRVAAPVQAVQLRICDHGTAGVDLIFERESAPI